MVVIKNYLMDANVDCFVAIKNVEQVREMSLERVCEIVAVKMK